MIEGLDEKAARTGGGVVDALARLRVDHLDDGADQRARGVELPGVATGVAHVLQQPLVDLGELEQLAFGLEVEGVDDVQHLAQGVAGGDLVIQVLEDGADLVAEGCWDRPGCRCGSP